MANPNNVGHLLFDAILPMYFEKSKSVKMYICGLKRMMNTAVVYNVKHHLSLYEKIITYVFLFYRLLENYYVVWGLGLFVFLFFFYSNL